MPAVLSLTPPDFGRLRRMCEMPDELAVIEGFRTPAGNGRSPGAADACARRVLTQPKGTLRAWVL